MPKELLASLKTKEIERRGLEERIRLLGAESNVTTLHPNVIKAFGKNIETLHEKLKRNSDDPECRMAFGNIIDSIIVHPTGNANLMTLAYMPDFRRLWESLTSSQPLAQTKKSLRQRDFLVSVQAEPLHHTHHHQDILLARHRANRVVRPRWHLFRPCRDGNQPIRRVSSALGLDRQRHRRHHLLAHCRRIHIDCVSHQRTSRRNPRPWRGTLDLISC
jgi:hypothetical protein